MNWKCLIGFHAWTHVDDFVIGGQRYCSPRGTDVIVGRRTIYYHLCDRCGMEEQYYPNAKQLVEIIKSRGTANAAAR